MKKYLDTEKMMKQMATALGGRIRRLRKERGYSQEGFADEAGISQAYLSRVERGMANPQLNRLLKIATCLGLSVAELCKVGLDTDSPRELSSDEKSRILVNAIRELPMGMAEKLYDTIAAQVKRK